MRPTVLKLLPLVATVVVIAGVLRFGGIATPADQGRPVGDSAPTDAAAPAPRSGGDHGDDAGTRRRIAELETRLAEEAALRTALQKQVADLAERIAAMTDAPAGSNPDGEAADTEAAAGQPADSEAGAAVAFEHTRPGDTVDYSKSPMQRALEAAGLDEATAEGIKHRGDQLAMTEMYLRDQATREGWLDTPRFKEEMEAVEAQRTSIRDEIGDDAYDRYLFALGRTNRVIVDDVMFDSVAEEVGLREGDLILSYGDTRIFAPDELVASTQGGPLEETVVLQVSRGGERIEIEVPRGPLGLRIGVAQDHPE